MLRGNGFLVGIAALAVGCVAPADEPRIDESDEALIAVGDGATAQATPPCYGSTCSGVNPQTSGCSNAANGTITIMQSVTIWSGSTAVGGVELKYSQWCNARWAKTYSYVGNVCIGAIMRTSSDVPGTNRYLCANSDIYSNMYGGGVASAKGYLYTGATTDTYREATTASQ